MITSRSKLITAIKMMERKLHQQQYKSFVYKKYVQNELSAYRAMLIVPMALAFVWGLRKGNKAAHISKSVLNILFWQFFGYLERELLTKR